MARILYWNINNFSLPKIQVAGPLAAAMEATQRLNYIVQDVMRGPVGGPIPDIIIVVEVFSRIREVGAEGTVLGSTGNAGTAVRLLLAQLRADATVGTVAAGTNWCVVPPINLGLLGQRETVAVFYNATNLQFTGPNLYWTLYPPPGFVVGQSQPVTAATHAAIMNYSPNWTNAMPALGRTTTFPVGGGATVTIPENQLAGEWQYYMPGTVRPIPSPLPPTMPINRILFPNEGCRAPFYTRFLEVGGAARTLNIFSVHTSPATARQAIFRMQNIQPMAAVPAGEVNVVLGDFNVDTFAGHLNAYNWMMPPLGPYTCQLDPRVGHAGGVVAARKPYCMTHFLPTVHATPFNTFGIAPDPQHNVYPRYGYMGSSWPAINDSGAIDNIFTAYGFGAAGAAANPTVVNTIAGTPYNLLGGATPAGVTAELTGGQPFNSTLGTNNVTAVPPAAMGTGGINGPNLIQETTFQGWNNFGKVYSTSDHMALMIDI
jgi:hypothetical protein